MGFQGSCRAVASDCLLADLIHYGYRVRRVRYLGCLKTVLRELQGGEPDFICVLFNLIRVLFDLVCCPLEFKSADLDALSIGKQQERHRCD